MINRLIKKIVRVPERFLFNSARYWDKRYRAGGTSGAGSYDQLAEFKARTLNQFVKEQDVISVVEFGCGDGNQLALAEYPLYTGYDVSPKAVELCLAAFKGDKTKQFKHASDWNGETADLALSLDVVFHLVEDKVFEDYMETLFKASGRYVVIYSSNYEDIVKSEALHVRHREFTQWVAENVPQWQLQRHIPNRFPITEYGDEGSFSDFYFFQISERHDNHNPESEELGEE